VQKSDTKPHNYYKLQNAALLLKDDNKISELVTQIKSSNFKITTDNINCLDKTQREPSLDMHDGNSLDIRPGMPGTLENVSIYCDSYHMNDNTNNKPPCMDFVGKAVSLDIGANVQTASQLTVIEPQSIIDFSGRFRE
jgi:hypothetical protein